MSNRWKVMLIAVSVAAALTACGRTAHLYPANEDASASGVLNVHFMAYGTGHGEVEIPMPDGELVRGEYTVVRGGTIGFGTIIAAVNARSGAVKGSATGSAVGTSYIVEGGSPGTVSAFGDRGTSIECEFYNDNFSGHGYGGCRSSRGGLYRLQY